MLERIKFTKWKQFQNYRLNQPNSTISNLIYKGVLQSTERKSEPDRLKLLYKLLLIVYWTRGGQWQVGGVHNEMNIYTANILTLISTAFGSVTCATVIWLYTLQPKIAIDLKLYS